MSCNAYMRRMEAVHDEGVKLGEKLTKQFMSDVGLIAAHRCLGLGPKRLAEFVKEWGMLYSKYYPAFWVAKANPEADVLRAELDVLLLESMPAGMSYEPFECRYPEIKKIKY